MEKNTPSGLFSFRSFSPLTRLSLSTEPPEKKVRPRIGLSAELLPEGCEFPKKWVCHDNFLIIGFGSTKEEAYADWHRRHYFRTRIPRPNNLITKEQAIEWREEGCPSNEWFLKNRHVYAYDPEKDELILRG